MFSWLSDLIEEHPFLAVIVAAVAGYLGGGTARNAVSSLLKWVASLVG